MKSSELANKWGRAESGTHYRDQRFGSARSRGRDERLLQKLVARTEGPGIWERSLDTPCGSGRLNEFLSARSQHTVALDVSKAMLNTHPGALRLCGSAFRLPFADRQFDAVVCCRLFHHLDQTDERALLLSELLRVARGPLYISFWDAGSWHAWRRRKGLRTVTNSDGRVAIAKRELERLIAAEGGEILGYAHSLRGISQQAWVALRRSSA